MELKLIELTDRDEICKTYDIYKHCMFMPTEEKFNKKIDTFLNDNFIKIFACLYRGERKGIIVIYFIEQFKIESIGIAVDDSVRHQGIGSYMISELVNEYSLTSIYAETDNDAVGFYRNNSFDITEFSENYNGENVIRYKCELIE